MDFRIIELPAFKAASSGVDKQFDFSPNGVLGKFNKFFSAIKPCPRDSFSPRDFLYYDEERQGLVWIWALSEDMDPGANEVLDFDGGYYLTYFYKDGDDIARQKLYDKALKYIEESETFDLDARPNHYAMGHIITPPEIIEAQGWAHMEAFVPIKLKK